ncbi:MAG: hypothetical protein GWP19_03175 [Planctomycetia bacterium]|nr:hypothetical protein [Planctomycetia bacterium]
MLNIFGIETCDHMTFQYEESCNMVIPDGSHRYITTYNCYDNAGLTILLQR